ncbi:hypothetical protein JCM17823_24400 [Halorubrum gandharaense]
MLDDLEFSLGTAVATHGTRLLVVVVALALYASGAAAEGAEFLVEPMEGGSQGDDGPVPDE